MCSRQVGGGWNDTWDAEIEELALTLCCACGGGNRHGAVEDPPPAIAAGCVDGLADGREAFVDSRGHDCVGYQREHLCDTRGDVSAYPSSPPRDHVHVQVCMYPPWAPRLPL